MENLINTIRQKGIGSMFAKSDYEILKENVISNKFVPSNHRLFYTGRQAMKFVIENIKLKQQIPTIWIPEYYCQHVTHWLKNNYNNTRLYEINAKDHNELLQVDTFAQEGDVIIVNNFWGVNRCAIDKGNKNITVIEDHSHGWLSSLCTNSKADYCVASLRKSIPAPLGGIAWRPDKMELKDIKTKENDLFRQIWDLISEAQNLKSTYIQATAPEEKSKQQFLQMMNDAEELMNRNFDLVALEDLHKRVLQESLLYNYIDYKKRNLLYLRSLITKSLKTKMPFELVAPNNHSFGLTLFLKTKEDMLSLRSYLISSAIYPSLLWPDNDSKYGYYLNIHIDFRYGNDEMRYIADIIANYA
jgi:hypothetical protein